MIRVSLDEKDFKDLVSGKIVKRDWEEQEVEIALKDIGYLLMIETISNVMKGRKEQS